MGFPSATLGFTRLVRRPAYPNTKKWYGSSGNSFVAVVEFGKDSVRAIAVTAGGESGDPKSKHFNDEAERYATGNLRPVYFYPNQFRGTRSGSTARGTERRIGWDALIGVYLEHRVSERIPVRARGAARPAQERGPTVTITLPFLCPSSTYRWASTISSNG